LLLLTFVFCSCMINVWGSFNVLRYNPNATNIVYNPNITNDIQILRIIMKNIFYYECIY